MAKTNRNQTQSYKAQFEDEYEDFGYNVKNARRYQSNKKRTPKFRDNDDTYDSYWTVYQSPHWHLDHVLYWSRQELNFERHSNPSGN